MNGENPLPGWLRQILIGIALFFAGAVLAFGYSYRPLHGAMTWRIEQLESRLDERNRENVRLSDALEKQQSLEEKKVDPETFAQVERELEKTKRVLTRAEKDLKRAERKRKEALTSATRWRKRFEELRDTPAPAPAPTPVPLASSGGIPAERGSTDETVVPKAAGPDAAPMAPAAPDPDSISPRDPSPAPLERGILLPDDADSGFATP